MEKIRFVIWGAGKRGKIAYDFLGEDKVIGFIDKNHKNILSFQDKPVFSFEDYLAEYKGYFVVVSPILCSEIIDTLQKNDIYQYLTLNECPSEVKGFGVADVIDQYLMKVGIDKRAILYGLTLFSVLFYEKSDHHHKILGIVPDEDTPAQTLGCVERMLNIPVLSFEHLADVASVEEPLTIYSVKAHKEAAIRKDASCLSHIIKDLYDFSDVIDGYYNPRIERFKGEGEGRRCFIVATGPSLRIEDLDILWKNQELCMGVNRIFKAFDQTSWRPIYYVAEDRDICREEKDNLLSLDVKYKFLSDSFVDIWNMGLDETYYQYHGCQSDFLPFLPEFSNDFAKKAYWGGTVTYVCLQLAVYMGFSQIYLLGVDFDYSYKDGNHFYKEDLTPPPPEQEDSLLSVKKSLLQAILGQGCMLKQME